MLVSNLSFNITSEHLKEILGHFGKVVSVDLRVTKKKIGGGGGGGKDAATSDKKKDAAVSASKAEPDNEISAVTTTSTMANDVGGSAVKAQFSSQEAIIEFSDLNEAEVAIKGMNGGVIDGCLVAVSKATLKDLTAPASAIIAAPRYGFKSNNGPRAPLRSSNRPPSPRGRRPYSPPPPARRMDRRPSRSPSPRPFRGGGRRYNRSPSPLRMRRRSRSPPPRGGRYGGPPARKNRSRSPLSPPSRRRSPVATRKVEKEEKPAAAPPPSFVNPERMRMVPS